MTKLLKFLVVFEFVLAICALWLGVLLFQKRELLKGRTQKLERAVVAFAATIEAEPPAAEPAPDYPGRDIDPATSEANPSPNRSEFWRKYRHELEREWPKTIDLTGRLSQLAAFYRIDPATLEPARDPLTGERMTDGPGTMQELLDETLAKASIQLSRMNDTRAELKGTREELVSTITDLNGNKQDLRVALNTIVKRDEAIVKLESTVKERDQLIAVRNQEIGELKDTVIERDATIAQRDGEISDLKREAVILKVALDDALRMPHVKPKLPSLVLTRGRMGKVAAVSTDWNFVVLEVTKEFIKGYETLTQHHRYEPDLELLVMRKSNGDKKFITKVHVNQVDLKQGLALADVLAEWKQKDVHEGDEVVY